MSERSWPQLEGKVIHDVVQRYKLLHIYFTDGSFMEIETTSWQWRAADNDTRFGR